MCSTYAIAFKYNDIVYENRFHIPHYHISLPCTRFTFSSMRIMHTLTCHKFYKWICTMLEYKTDYKHAFNVYFCISFHFFSNISQDLEPINRKKISEINAIWILINILTKNKISYHVFDESSMFFDVNRLQSWKTAPFTNKFIF